MVANRAKANDKQDICKKLMTLLKKHYGTPTAPPTLPTLETMLYSVCLENASDTAATAAYLRLREDFHDLNEIRVSSMEELEIVFQGMHDPDWRAMRIRGILQHVFEDTYEFEFEQIKRKTLELASKQLTKIKALSPFNRGYTLQQSLGAHVLPIDDLMNNALIWLDLSPVDTPPEQSGESLRSFVRKSDGPLFCRYLRAVASDSRFEKIFRTPFSEDSPEAAIKPVSRLEKVLNGEQLSAPKTAKKTSARKTAPPPPAEKEKKAAAKKTPKKTASKPAKKPAPTAKKKTEPAAKTGKAAKKKGKSTARR